MNDFASCWAEIPGDDDCMKEERIAEGGSEVLLVRLLEFELLVVDDRPTESSVI